MLSAHFDRCGLELLAGLEVTPLDMENAQEDLGRARAAQAPAADAMVGKLNKKTFTIEIGEKKLARGNTG